MDARQYSHIARSHALVALFSTRPETPTLAGLPETLALFTAQLDLVETLVKRQAQSLDAVLHERDAVFAALKIAALTVAGKVAAFARRMQRDSLALSVRVTGGELERARFVDRVRRCHQIYEAVVAEGPAIAAAGVTPALLADFQTKIDAAREWIEAPRATVIDKATATVQLAEAIRALTAILTQQIEPLVAPCEFTHREFFLMFRAARKLIAPPRGSAGSAESVEAAETAEEAGEKTGEAAGVDTTAAAAVSSPAAAAMASTATAAPMVSEAHATPVVSAAAERTQVASDVASPVPADQRASAPDVRGELHDSKSDLGATVTTPAPATPRTSPRRAPPENGMAALFASRVRTGPPAVTFSLNVAAPPKAA